MTDFDYENMQKKITARGARHKKGGSKSRKCTMPSDYLTPAQKAALNGPVTTILLNQPMDWATYRDKNLSDTLRVKYIKNLQETYRASGVMLARMFGVSQGAMCRGMKRLGLKPAKDATDNRGADYERKLAVWDAFCNGVVGGGDNVQPKEDAPAEEPQVTCYDVDAEAFERAKAAVDLLCHGAEQMQEAAPENEEVPDDYDWREDWDRTLAEPVEPDPDEELADAILDAFNKACEPAPCAMSKLATTMTGSPEGVVDNIRDLLSLFSGKVSVKLSVEVAE